MLMKTEMNYGLELYLGIGFLNLAEHDGPLLSRIKELRKTYPDLPVVHVVDHIRLERVM